jgi:cell shape-determining protein MreC
MSYLLDKKEKRKKSLNIFLGILVLVVLFYFRANLWRGFSSVVLFSFRPVLILGNSVGEKFSNLGAYFVSKSSLVAENQSMRAKLSEEESRMINYNIIFAENENLKGILGRKNINTMMVLGNILARPNKSPYDTIVIDVGTGQGIKVGNTVFALGNVPIGKVAEVYSNSSKIILFSSPGEKTQAIIPGKDIFMELIGRGGGNFEMVLPRDLTLQEGDQVTMPGINPYVLATVETIISDLRDSFTKALLVSPVNIQELKFVEVAQ